MEEPTLTRNPISLAGAALTTVAALAFVLYYVSHSLGWWLSPYAGLFGFIAVPAIFLLGLILIPLGMWFEARRRRRGVKAWTWPLIDLSSHRTRVVFLTVLVLSLANLGIVLLATAGAAHYMESNEFCGQVCHVPMRPEFTSHQAGPHARVACVSCHIAPGAAGTIRAKLNGTRQLYGVLTGHFERPIPSPARGLPIAAETCARCHTPAHPMPDTTRILREFDEDEANTESEMTLVVMPNANHWHAREDVRVEYIASDSSRETIPYVRVTEPGGGVTEYFAPGVTAAPAGERRVMDCIDCHSRPAHRMSSSAEQEVNRALAAGAVSRDLPFVRRELVAALTAPYPDENTAVAAIAEKLSGFYMAHPTAASDQVSAAIATGQRLFRTNVFPEMKVTWGTYRNQLGHTADVPGCFRCHDDEKSSRDGKLVRQDCGLCHKEP